jgi:hypothetical protein
MGKPSNILTGARVRLEVNGVKLGYCTGCNITEEITYEPLKVLDNIETEELVPTDYNVTFTAAHVRVKGTTLKSLGYFPKTGTTPDEHLVNIMNQGELSGAVIDKISPSKTIMLLERVKCGSKALAITARGLVGEDVTFQALRVRDESEV